ncbi:carnitine dehydratase [Zhengella mangrovi]|uniref:Carnitine dehydratase n=2 Tax=Zhengella mangrovi TaxID=1982044 RepID=A0A2G1QQM5_9HYPH|nr:carnitine dehydratase [Zhengella mangrovi]
MSSNQPFRQSPLYMARPPEAPLALQGVRVVDFTRYLAGPASTQVLADLGAEVIKIEAVGTGDETRSYQPPDVDGESPYFIGLNRGKKSICLNLASEGGTAIVNDLVRRADIVVENFAPGVMSRLGIDYGALKQINPRLIYCAITAYGSGNSHSDQPGFDSVFQAESGFASLTGDPDRLPMRTGSPVIDIGAAMNGTMAVLAALFARERTGAGQYVEVSMFDTALNMLAYFPMNYLAGGRDPVRQGNTAPVATPIGMFETADGGPIYVSCGSQKSWEALATHVLDRPDLLQDPHYATNRDRNANRDRLFGVMTGIFLGRPRDHWIEKARAGRVPVGAVRTIGEALRSPLAVETNVVTRVVRADGGEVPNIASPLRLSATPVADPVAAPRLDADRDHILRDLLGYDAARISEARDQGAFSQRTSTKRQNGGQK